MPYNRNTEPESPFTLGNDGAAISLASTDYTVPSTVKAIVVVATGDVVCRPRYASADITITDAPVGMILPWHCKTIVRTGTTATLATVAS